MRCSECQGRWYVFENHAEWWVYPSACRALVRWQALVRSCKLDGHCALLSFLWSHPVLWPHDVSFLAQVKKSSALCCTHSSHILKLKTSWRFAPSKLTQKERWLSTQMERMLVSCGKFFHRELNPTSRTRRRWTGSWRRAANGILHTVKPIWWPNRKEYDELSKPWKLHYQNK